MTEERDRFYRPDQASAKAALGIERSPITGYPDAERELVPGSFARGVSGLGTQTATGLTISYERVVRHEAELAERLRCALVVLTTGGIYDVRTKESLEKILGGGPAVPITPSF